MAEAPLVIGALCNQTATWAEMQTKYPKFEEQQVEK
jgi:hypothetical protein